MLQFCILVFHLRVVSPVAAAGLTKRSTTRPYLRRSELRLLYGAQPSNLYAAARILEREEIDLCRRVN